MVMSFKTLKVLFCFQYALINKEKNDTYIHIVRLKQLHLKGILEFPQLYELCMLMTFFRQGYTLSNSEL